MTDLTPEARAALKALCDTLPPGEWKPIHSNYAYHDILKPDEHTTIEVQPFDPRLRTAEEIAEVRARYLDFICAARTALPAVLQLLDAAEQERDELISTEHASMLVAERDNYKAGYEATMVLVHELIASLAAASARAEAAEQRISAAVYVASLYEETDDPVLRNVVTRILDVLEHGPGLEKPA